MNESNSLTNIKLSSMQKEFVRKSIHMTIALVPTFAIINFDITIMLLAFGTLFYLINEFYRSRGVVLLGFISSVSAIASRERDNGMTLGPITLAIGAITVLSIFSPTAATCGIYALAFGDGLSSVTGKLLGRVKIPFTRGKSLVGFFTCFTMILSTTYGVTGSLKTALLAAIAGSVTELIPVKDLDNLLIPVVVALVVSI